MKYKQMQENFAFYLKGSQKKKKGKKTALARKKKKKLGKK